MADRGMGLRIFRNKSELGNILQELEDGNGDEDDDDGRNGDTMVSQLRHFVIQVYFKINNF
jgi:hypothetical protein